VNVLKIAQAAPGYNVSALAARPVRTERRRRFGRTGWQFVMPGSVRLSVVASGSDLDSGRTGAGSAQALEARALHPMRTRR